MSIGLFPCYRAEGPTAKRDAMAAHVRGPYTLYPDGRIGCFVYHEWETPENQWSPYLADPDDIYEHCQVIHALAKHRMDGGTPYETGQYPTFVVEPDPRDAQIAALEARIAALENPT